MDNFRTLMIAAILTVLAEANIIYRNRQSSVPMYVNAMAASAAIGNSGASKMSSIAIYGKDSSPASVQAGSLEANKAIIVQDEPLTTEELADAIVTTNFTGMDQFSEASEPTEFLASGSLMEYNQMGWAGALGEGEAGVAGTSGSGTENFMEP